LLLSRQPALPELYRLVQTAKLRTARTEEPAGGSFAMKMAGLSVPLRAGLFSVKIPPTSKNLITEKQGILLGFS